MTFAGPCDGRAQPLHTPVSWSGFGKQPGGVALLLGVKRQLVRAAAIARAARTQGAGYRSIKNQMKALGYGWVG